jgi:hypothetical protein
VIDVCRNTIRELNGRSLGRPTCIRYERAEKRRGKVPSKLLAFLAAPSQRGPTSVRTTVRFSFVRKSKGRALYAIIGYAPIESNQFTSLVHAMGTGNRGDYELGDDRSREGID